MVIVIAPPVVVTVTVIVLVKALVWAGAVINMSAVVLGIGFAVSKLLKDFCC